ncbi:MAG: hypothetical protein DLM68_14130 [Hyphomicrobiales bacterium]|nr:MAG: hypothetical protein DLM68_14130 [Hyphomicrobiales bacterium]
MLAKSPRIDPIFALIEDHKSSLDHINRTTGPEDLPEGPVNVEMWKWMKLVKTRPQTLAGLTAFAEYVASYPEIMTMCGDKGSAIAVETIAEALRDIALAANGNTPISSGDRKSAVAEVVARHKAAQSAYDAGAAACAAQPGDTAADKIASALTEEESVACEELERTPCSSDAEFLEKLKCLINRETRLFGSPFESRAQFVSVARAVALHFEAGPDP